MARTDRPRQRIVLAAWMLVACGFGLQAGLCVPQEGLYPLIAKIVGVSVVIVGVTATIIMPWLVNQRHQIGGTKPPPPPPPRPQHPDVSMRHGVIIRGVSADGGRMRGHQGGVHIEPGEYVIPEPSPGVQPPGAKPHEPKGPPERRQ